MEGYWTVKETAEHWGITVRRILALCNSGRIEGAVRFGHVWAIPAGSEKPKDARIKSGKYIKNKEP